MFGDFAWELRRQKQLTLREFCSEAKVQAEQWGEIERNIEPPPASDVMLEKIAVTLGLERDSENWKKFFDLAKIGVRAGRNPRTEQELAKTLPMFCRTLDNCKPSEEELRGLSDLLRHG